MPRHANSRLKAAVHQIRREEIESGRVAHRVQVRVPSTSLRLVANEAKVPLSILHYYFRDKNELMHRVVQRLFDGMLRAFDRIRSSEPDQQRLTHRLNRHRHHLEED